MTLIQTGKIVDFPVVLLGRAYWQPFADLLQHLAAEGTIAAADLDLLLITDSVSDALSHISRHAMQRFGIAPRAVRPLGILGESAHLA